MASRALWSDGTSSGDLQPVTQTHLSISGDGPYTLVEGRVASGVTGVTLVRDDGQEVVATVDDGWVIAWWPGSATATSARVNTASATTNEALVPAAKSPMLPPGSPGTCLPGETGAPSSSGSSGGRAVSCGSSSGNSGNSGNTGPAGNSGG